MSEAMDLGRFATRRSFARDDAGEVGRLIVRGVPRQHISQMTGLSTAVALPAAAELGVAEPLAEQLIVGLICLALQIHAYASPMRPSASEIVADVARRHGLTPSELTAPSKRRPIVRARWEAMWLLRTLTRLSLLQIARRLGLRDHTTVLHGLRRYAEMLGNRETG